MRRLHWALSVVAAALLLGGSAAAKEENGENVVSSTGVVVLHPAPTGFRVQMELRSFGKTADAALANLKARREAAAEQLKKLGVDPASIVFAVPRAAAIEPPSAMPPTYSAPLAPAPSYSPALVPPSAAPAPDSSADPFGTSVETTPIQAITPGYAAPPPTATYPSAPRSSRNSKKRPPLFAAVTTLRADWRLTETDPDRIASLTAAICEKVKAADLPNAGKQNISPEEQELIEESGMGLSSSVAPGYASPASSAWSPYASPASPAWSPQPRFAGSAFSFVATISDAQRQAAVAKAFAQAKKDAADLAAAAGMQLGPIMELALPTEGLCSSKASRTFSYSSEGGASTTADSQEDVSVSADALEFAVRVTAKFRLLPARP
jgi:uncharacterized protein YggE